MYAQNRFHKVLLIEDNPGDVRLTQEAFKEIGSDVVLEVVMDGVEALRFLYREGEYAHKEKPDLILLDLNIPKRDGREVLQQIKNDSELEDIPVIILTTSNAEKDILKCYELKANCYLNKPLDFNKFFEIIQKIKNFWLSAPMAVQN